MPTSFPPNSDFTPVGQMQIRYALGAIKGTGEGAVEAIVAARESGGSRAVIHNSSK